MTVVFNKNHIDRICFVCGSREEQVDWLLIDFNWWAQLEAFEEHLPFMTRIKTSRADAWQHPIQAVLSACAKHERRLRDMYRDSVVQGFDLFPEFVQKYRGDCDHLIRIGDKILTCEDCGEIMDHGGMCVLRNMPKRMIDCFRIIKSYE